MESDVLTVELLTVRMSGAIPLLPIPRGVDKKTLPFYLCYFCGPTLYPGLVLLCNTFVCKIYMYEI
jgi:hypothetical protein